MADRASITIRIGGSLSPTLLPAFITAIESDGACCDWEGTVFHPEYLDPSQPLDLVATEVAWGQFEAIKNSVQIMVFSLPVGLAVRGDPLVLSASSSMARSCRVSQHRMLMRS